MTIRYARKSNEDEFGSKVLKRGMYFYNILPTIWYLWHLLLNWGRTFHCNVALKIIKFWNSIWQVILGQLSDSLRGYLWIKITQNYAEILVLSNEWYFLQILRSSQSLWILPSRTSRMAPIQQECLRRIHTLRRQQRPPSKPTIVCRRPFWRIPRPEIIHR